MQDDVCVVDHWLVSGTHYSRTRFDVKLKIEINVESVVLYAS